MMLYQTAKFGVTEWLVVRAQKVREALLRFGGVQVAGGVLAGSNFFTAVFLILSGAQLFGHPASESEITSNVWRAIWNLATCNAGYCLLLVTLILFHGWHHKRMLWLWWGSAFSAALWGGLLVFMWIAYLSGTAPLASTHFNALIPLTLGMFICMRLSAETESAGHAFLWHGGNDRIQGATEKNAK